MTLAEKLARWKELAEELQALEAEIKEEVMSLRQTVEAHGVRATYSDGRGKYDWESIAKAMEPDDELIEQFTKATVDWRSVAQALNPPENLMEVYYQPGKPYVSLKLL